MILPIIAYGDPVLKRPADEIEEEWDGLEALIENMWDTMYNANGVGLAAPQIGESLRLFVIDTIQLEEDNEGLTGVKKAFINPIIVEESGKKWPYEEGCLSIPRIREDVMRPPSIIIEYFNEEWELIEESYDGVNARVIQHEYDHVEGILFIEHLGSIKRKFLKKKLQMIAKGLVDTDYKMKYPKLKR